MSALESENIPHMKPMILDTPIILDEAQQRSVAAWGVKTAMVSDSMKGRNAPNRFYEKAECVALRESRTIPELTRIWIGRVDEFNHLWDAGTDVSLMGSDGTRTGTASVHSFVAGHFVIQIVSGHRMAGYEGNIQIPCKIGDWDSMLIPIWPVQEPTVSWPPKVSFTNGGPLGIAYLQDRWRLGGIVKMVTKDGVVE